MKQHVYPFWIAAHQRPLSHSAVTVHRPCLCVSCRQAEAPPVSKASSLTCRCLHPDHGQGHVTVEEEGGGCTPTAVTNKGCAVIIIVFLLFHIRSLNL